MRRDGHSGRGWLAQRGRDIRSGLLPVGSDEAIGPADDKLRRVETARAKRRSVRTLPCRVVGGGERIGPPELVPVVDVELEREDAGIGGNFSEHSVGRRAAAASLRGEELHDDRASAAAVAVRLVRTRLGDGGGTRRAASCEQDCEQARGCRGGRPHGMDTVPRGVGYPRPMRMPREARRALQSLLQAGREQRDGVNRGASRHADLGSPDLRRSP